MRGSCDILLFVFGMTGCDTTSALYKKGEIRALRILQNYKFLREQMLVFHHKDASRDDTGLSQNHDDLGYCMYNITISKKKLSTSLQLATLPQPVQLKSNTPTVCICRYKNGLVIALDFSQQP